MADDASKTFGGGLRNYLGALGFILPLGGGRRTNSPLCRHSASVIALVGEHSPDRQWLSNIHIARDLGAGSPHKAFCRPPSRLPSWRRLGTWGRHPFHGMEFSMGKGVRVTILGQ